jgi:hypothetical protein
MSVALAKSKRFVSPHILLVVLYCHLRNYLVAGGGKHQLSLKEKVGTVFLSSQSKADKGQEEHGNAEVNEAKSRTTVQFPTGGKARDKGFDKSIIVVVVVAFSAIRIEMIDSYSSRRQ